jgi:ribosome-associated protein
LNPGTLRFDRERDFVRLDNAWENDDMEPNSFASLDAEPDGVYITPQLIIRPDELRYRFSRSGGPGGQHVNRSETRVELLFDIANSPSLTESQRHTLLHRLSGQVDANGVLRIVSSATRSQAENREDALRRFQALLAGALKERRRRVATRPTRAARERRLEEKRQRSSVKSTRRRPRSFEDE